MSLYIHLHHLRLGGRDLLRSVHIQVPPGVVHTVMGPSGCGKSSLLAAVCGTLAPAFDCAASVTLGGQRLDHLPTEQRRIGLLFQDPLLFAHMSVRENLLFALRGGTRAQREAAVAQAMAQLDVSALAHANPATLSGGQAARVALMRALLAQPQALLLDEPFSRLDAQLRQRVRQHVFATVRQRGIPALLVTHDAADVADSAHLTLLQSLDDPQSQPA